MPDPTAARFWFGVAAESGSASAQLNLALMHSLGAGTNRDTSEAERYFQLAMANPARPPDLAPVSLDRLVQVSCDPAVARPSPGSEIFGTFCAGCHGAIGLAEYRAAPSFALGERMDKSDNELLASIEGGHQDMPQWSEKLPRPWLLEALKYVRGLSDDFRLGVLHRVRQLPERAFRFGPMDPELSSQRIEPSLGVEAPLPSFGAFCDRLDEPGG
jgi:mono/diheme cytochrome c family protein